MIYKNVKKIHMIGIGGSGMSGLAEILINLNFEITGSDIKKTDITERLKKLGAKIYYNHRRENLSDPDLVVLSTAIKEDNPELLEAKRKKIVILKRGELLAEIAKMKHTIAVTGTHGKTTTTSMVSMVLESGGLNPTAIVGGIVKNFASGAVFRDSKFFVIELDESDGSFLKTPSDISIVTNIDNDHLDFYKNFHNLKKAFLKYINQLTKFPLLCGDDQVIASLLSKVKKKYQLYGLKECNQIIAKNIKQKKLSASFDVFHENLSLGRFTINIPGIHNIVNSLSAVASGLKLDIPTKYIKEGLEKFKGIDRRMEIIGRYKGVIFIDDYAHHPTEIKTTLKTISEVFRPSRILVVFQPHRYSRTKILHKEFGKAFQLAESVHLMEIYPASEKPITGVSSKLIYNSLKENGTRVFYFQLDKFVKLIKKGDVVVSLGAGDVNKSCELVFKMWRS